MSTTPGSTGAPDPVAHGHEHPSGMPAPGTAETNTRQHSRSAAEEVSSSTGADGDNWPVARKHPPPERGVAGVVRRFDADEGGGVIVAPDVPGDCFVRFSDSESSGYRELRAGQRARFTYEEPGFRQDGCRFRALQVWPQT